MKQWEDAWLDTIESYSCDVNISSFIFAGCDANMTGSELDVILKDNSTVWVDESW